MRTRLAAVLAFAVPAAMAEARELQADASADLLIEGVPAGHIQKWEGGEPRANVVVDPPGAGRISKKRAGGLRYAPIVLELDLPTAKPLADWMNEFLPGKPTPKKAVLNRRSPSGLALSSLRTDRCSLVKIAFPAVDASSKEPARLVLTLHPELIRTEQGVGVGDTRPPKTAVQGAFHLDIDGVDGSKVRRLEEPTLAFKPDESDPVGVLNIPYLILFLSEDAPADWRAWRGELVDEIQRPKNGSLSYLSADLKERLFTVNFKTLGLLSQGEE
jgi:hypothetical protein